MIIFLGNNITLIDKIIKNTKIEYEKFRENELLKDKAYVFRDYNIIRFYVELYLFIQDSKYLESLYSVRLGEDYLKILCDEGMSLIYNLYFYYLKHEDKSIDNWEHIEDMIYGYISLIRGD